MSYGMLHEYNTGDIRPIGTFCHEIGHVLGLPDLYDMDSWYGIDEIETIWSSGIGYWGLMGSGNHNRQTSPSYMCAWSRAKLNWISTEMYGTGLIPLKLLVPPAENNHIPLFGSIGDDVFRGHR